LPNRAQNLKSVALGVAKIFHGCKGLTTPFQGRFVTDRLEHAMVNLPTIFEVPNFTRYGNMKDVANKV